MEVDEPLEETVSPMVVEEEQCDDEAAGNIQADDLAAEPLPVIDRAEPWHAQFPSNWLPIITRDVSRQQRQVRSLPRPLGASSLTASCSPTGTTAAFFRCLHLGNVIEAPEGSAGQAAVDKHSALGCRKRSSGAGSEEASHVGFIVVLARSTPRRDSRRHRQRSSRSERLPRRSQSGRHPATEDRPRLRREVAPELVKGLQIGRPDASTLER